MSAHSSVHRAIASLAPRSTASGVSSGQLRAPKPSSPAVTLRPLDLPAGRLVRISNGAGVIVHATSGVLWITEEGSAEDIVLYAGGVHRIAGSGDTLIEAQTTARLMLESLARHETSTSIEFVAPDGPPPGGAGPATPATVQVHGRLARMGRTFAAFIRAAFAGPREMPTMAHSSPASADHDRDMHLPDAVRARLRQTARFPYY